MSTKLRTLLSGKKTYILAFIGGTVLALNLLGVIDQDVANQILTMLGFGSIVTLRASIK